MISIIFQTSQQHLISSDESFVGKNNHAAGERDLQLVNLNLKNTNFTFIS